MENGKKDGEPVQSSQVQVNFDTGSNELVSVSPSISKTIKSRLLSKSPRSSKTESVELHGMSYNRQSSGYELGFTKSYLSGSIQFVSDYAHQYKPRKYMVVQPDEKPEVILNALAKKWNLPLPKLLICLVGCDTTTANLSMQKAFSKELVEALLRTDGWFFTDGLNCGMLEIVGQALTNYLIGRVSRQNGVAVGVAPLNVLSQKQRLLGSERNPVKYIVSHNEDSSIKCLEPNHTHFILVDDQQDKKIEDEAKIRDKLVRTIASCKIKGTKETVPALYLVFGGGVTAIQAVFYAVVDSKIPVLIIPSSGGAADVLTDAFKESPRGGDTDLGQMSYDIKLNAIMGSKMDIESDSRLRTKEQINQIIKRRHLINIYDKEVRIEEEILKALMKASRGSKGKDELQLAVIWNRMERAKELVTHKKWKNRELHNAVYYSLVNNHSKFVRLFIDEAHFDLKKFLSPGMLTKLYNEVSTSSVLFDLLSKQRAKRTKKPCQFTLGDVGNILKELIFDTYESSYMKTPAKEDGSEMNHSGKEDDELTYEDPLRELFVWAVLQHHFSMAKFFWERGKPSIGGALFASKLLKEMSSLVKFDPQESSKMHKNAKEFQKMAIELLGLCFAEDRRRTSTLLVRKLPDWGYVTCLNLAAAGRNKEFIAQDAVQNLLSELWMGRISRGTGWFKIFFCMAVPFACLCMVTFMSKDDPSVPAEAMMKRKAIQDGLENCTSHEDLTKTGHRVKHGDDGYQP